MRQRRWIELFSDYDCKICYHPGKANVVADALSRKERVKPKRVRAMNMTLQSSIKDRILAAQKEVVDEFTGLQRCLEEMIEPRSDGTLYYLDQIWVPLKDDVKAEHQRPSGLLQKPEIPIWKWEGIAMDFVTELPRTSSGHDIIWFIVDRLTKSAHFLPMREDYKMDRLAILYLNEIVARHGMLRAYVLDFRGSWDVHLSSVEFSYNNSYHYSVRCDPFEALYGRKYRSPIMWAKIKDRLKAACDCQKSYADKRRKPLEFSVGDYVLLKVSPWKGVVRFRKKEKLAPRFVEPFQIIEKVGPKCLADPTLQVPLDEIQVDAKLNFVEEPVEILEREFKKLKRSRIAIVMVRWNSIRGPEFT
ncbi:putative reverse transcriptase domain-containing protein [Tanacetum coccineum]